MARARAAVVGVFLGPSLPAGEARRLGPCRVLPPARAGAVLAVHPARPLALAIARLRRAGAHRAIAVDLAGPPGIAVVKGIVPGLLLSELL